MLVALDTPLHLVMRWTQMPSRITQSRACSRASLSGQSFSLSRTSLQSGCTQGLSSKRRRHGAVKESGAVTYQSASGDRPPPPPPPPPPPRCLARERRRRTSPKSMIPIRLQHASADRGLPPMPRSCAIAWVPARERAYLLLTSRGSSFVSS